MDTQYRKPFLLHPSGKDNLWGGQRLNTEFEKQIPMDPLAETWECSTHPDGPSFVMSGKHKGKTLAEVIEPVSYTHLDVYKRQLLNYVTN